MGGLEDPAVQKSLWVAALSLLPVATIVCAKLLGFCFSLIGSRKTVSAVIVTAVVSLVTVVCAGAAIIAWYYARSHFGWVPGDWIWILAIMWAVCLVSVFKTPLLAEKKPKASGSSLTKSGD